MKESRFINQNAEKWTELETMLNEGTSDPDRLSELFVEVTDDLSFARTYYPYRKVRSYLNTISQRLYQNIYRNKKLHLSELKKFWQQDLPLSVWHARKVFLLTFIIFLIFFGIGIISCLNDGQFAARILGQGYVEMTMENIAKGDPMAVYKDEDDINMFFQITWNNLRVSFRFFISGLLAGAGTILYLMYNAIMVGTFQFFFWDKGVFLESFITIWQHGTIEISCMIIAASAGLVLAKGIVFPGSYPRMQALQLSAVKGVKIMAGIAPLIIIAGFIESYITRLTDAPLLFRIFVLAASALFILWYFVIYPYRVARAAGFPAEENPVPERKDEIKPLPTGRIYTTGTIIMQALLVFRNEWVKYLNLLLPLSILLSFTLVFILDRYEYFDYFTETYGMESFWSTFTAMFYFTEFYPIFTVSPLTAEGLILVLLSFSALFLSTKSLRNQAIEAPSDRLLATVILAEVVVLHLPFLLESAGSWVLFFPLLFIMGFINSGIFLKGESWTESLSLIKHKRMQSLALLGSSFIILSTLLMITSAAFTRIILDLIMSNFIIEAEQADVFFHFYTIGISLIALGLGMIIMLLAGHFHYFSVRESVTAENLSERISKLFAANQ